MKALVTGGGGFLGSALVRALVARGDTVRVLARSDYPELRSLGVETRRGDIRDLASVTTACNGIDLVFHTAALAGGWGDKGKLMCWPIATTPSSSLRPRLLVHDRCPAKFVPFVTASTRAHCNSTERWWNCPSIGRKSVAS